MHEHANSASHIAVSESEMGNHNVNFFLKKASSSIYWTRTVSFLTFNFVDVDILSFLIPAYGPISDLISLMSFIMNSLATCRDVAHRQEHIPRWYH
jgi:hypothetical protein